MPYLTIHLPILKCLPIRHTDRTRRGAPRGEDATEDVTEDVTEDRTKEGEAKVEEGKGNR